MDEPSKKKQPFRVHFLELAALYGVGAGETIWHVWLNGCKDRDIILLIIGSVLAVYCVYRAMEAVACWIDIQWAKRKKSRPTTCQVHDWPDCPACGNN